MPAHLEWEQNFPAEAPLASLSDWLRIALNEWLGLLRTEYLSGYVRDGGAAVKFVTVPDDVTAGRIKDGTSATARDLGFLVVEVRAERVKIHMMQHLFHEVAKQVPWTELSRDVVRACYKRVCGEDPGGDLRIDAVAAQRNENPALLRAEMRKEIQGLIDRGSELARDFRYAMLWLCMAQISNSPSDEDAVLQWLKGELRLITAARRLIIYRKIDRHNARAMLSSLGAWCRLAGLPGLTLLLDIRQRGVAKRADVRDGDVHYGLPATMDAYEVLRQLVDATDDLTGILAVVIASPELFEDEKRGVKVYKALYERVWPDGRLKQRPNPLSALATIEETEVARV